MASFPVPASLRLATRRLRKSPRFTALAVATLAIGIGLNSSVFSVVSALLLRPLPVAEPERLVHVYSWEESGPFPHAPMAFPDYRDLRDDDTFEGVAAHTLTSLALEHGGGHEVILGALVSGNYFDLLGVAPALGRTFAGAEAEPGQAGEVVVLAHATWRRRFGSDPGVLGRRLRLNGHPLTVIGVAPPGYHGLMRGIEPELYLPIALAPRIHAGSIASSGDPTPGLDRLQDRARRWHWVTARLRPGSSLAQAAGATEAFAARLAERYPDSNAERRLVLVPAEQVRFFPGVDQALYAGALVLLGVVGLVLLIACANLANLLLARAVTRRKEMATRLALGAGRQQLAGQLLAESLLLAALGGVAGLGLAALSNRLLTGADLPLPVRLELGLALDLRVIVFTTLASGLTAILFGLVPVFEATRVNLAATLHDASRGSSGGVARSRLRSALVVAQVALSLTLLLGAALAVRSLQNAHRIDPGFEPEGVVVARLGPALQGYDEARATAFFEQLLERLRSQPAVRAASQASHLPLTFNISVEAVAGERQVAEEPESWPAVDSARVGPGYFRTLGVPLRAGRDFTARDDGDAPRAAIVNDTLAHQLWPGREAVGQQLYLGDRQQVLEVVGVVATGKYRTLGEAPRPFLYRALGQEPEGARSILVRAAGDPGQALAAIRLAVRELDPNLAVTGLETLTEATASSLALPRMGAAFLGAFGAVGLLLAMVGLYGVVSYLVSQRTGEIGIRMALGADPLRMLFHVLGDGLRLTAVGVAVGLALALVTSRFLDAILYGVSATDPLTFAGVPLLFLAVAALAALAPARRASSVDPIVALRHE